MDALWVPSVLRGTSSSSAPRDLGGLLVVLKGLLGERPLLLGDQLPGGRLLGGRLGGWLPFNILVLGFLHQPQLWLDKLERCQHSQDDSHGLFGKHNDVV